MLSTHFATSVSDPFACPDLMEYSKWCYDENCYMPTLRCGAIGSARCKLLQQGTTYIVTEVGIDFGGYSRDIRSFASESEAIDFMLDWQGSGDFLRLTKDERCVGTLELDGYQTFVYAMNPTMQVYRDCNEVSDDELPF